MLKDTGFQDTTLFSLFDKKGFLSKIHSRNKQLKMEDFPLPVRPTIAMCDLDGTENEIELRAGGISGAYWVRDLTSVDANDNIYELFLKLSEKHSSRQYWNGFQMSLSEIKNINIRWERKWIAKMNTVVSRDNKY